MDEETVARDACAYASNAENFARGLAMRSMQAREIEEAQWFAVTQERLVPTMDYKAFTRFADDAENASMDALECEQLERAAWVTAFAARATAKEKAEHAWDAVQKNGGLSPRD